MASLPTRRKSPTRGCPSEQTERCRSSCVLARVDDVVQEAGRAAALFWSTCGRYFVLTCPSARLCRHVATQEEATHSITVRYWSQSVIYDLQSSNSGEVSQLKQSVKTARLRQPSLRNSRGGSQLRFRLRRTPTNGWTACRMRLHMPSAGLGLGSPKPLRPYACADAYGD